MNIGALVGRVAKLFINRGVSASDVIADPDADSSAFVSGPPAWILVWLLVLAFLWVWLRAAYGSAPAVNALVQAGTTYVSLVLGLSGFLTVHRVGSKFAKARAAAADSGGSAGGNAGVGDGQAP